MDRTETTSVQTSQDTTPHNPTTPPIVQGAEAHLLPQPVVALNPGGSQEPSDIRVKFFDYFDECRWNHPSKTYPEMEKELSERKALVIVVQYLPPVHLIGTFLDAYNIAGMLENQFDYPPKCIRVLADCLDPAGKIDDETWPTKENIKKGLKWLSEGCADGARRFLYFAGHGYTPRDGGETGSAGGIYPVDYQQVITSRGDEPIAFVVPRSVLFDWELNNGIVDSLPDKKIKLTVIFDSCFSDSLSNFNPGAEDMTNIRGRHLFVRQRRSSESAETKQDSNTDQEHAPGIGNLLDLPVEITDLDHSNEILVASTETEAAASNTENRSQIEFKLFPKNCEVVSWYAAERNEEAQELKGVGGMFTTAFIRSIAHPEPGCRRTYRELNKFIWKAFDRRNQAVERSKAAQVQSGNPEAAHNKSSQNSKLKYQHPKLYVSENIAKSFADNLVDI